MSKGPLDVKFAIDWLPLKLALDNSIAATREFLQEMLATAEKELRDLEARITAMKVELAQPAPEPRRSLSSRGSLPRILFMSMQRDLNRPLTQEQQTRYRNTTQEQIALLTQRRNELAHDLAEAKKSVNAEKATNGHTHEFLQEASPAEIIIFSKKGV